MEIEWSYFWLTLLSPWFKQKVILFLLFITTLAHWGCVQKYCTFFAFFVFLTVYDVSMKQFIFHSIENISDSN